MDIILIPGLWLTAPSWDSVAGGLEKAGHVPHALTLPGMHSPDGRRHGVTRQDHVDAVVAAVDAVDGGRPVLLVGHSMGGVLAWAAAAERLDRVSGVVFVASEPAVPEQSASMFPVVGDDVPLPPWGFFDDEMVADLDDDLRSRIRDEAVPSPVRAVTDGLSFDGGEGDRLHDLPVTMVTAEYDAAQLQQWVAAGESGTEEIARLRAVTWVDLHSGHWPQYSRVDDTVDAVLGAVLRA
ncbi:MAG TPA: alpha/beta fold hydrolase [Nocardioides sp.]|jgi:pimeloyl-ACP methyl ester carboxylesterase|uniref:alpha/beta fold hydrolase n=1 Tax=Nocardioides sp. TaxID=35761 RepID=UPI002E33374E|nr:alpha/beta fold hydrolase [Nocardioides sp.]HEX3930292.1 alpha/beta fold hydrolase [Nocardioides sp.]